MDTARGLVVAAHASEAFAAQWQNLQKGARLTLGHVAREGFAFAAAVAIETLAGKRIWLVCGDVRMQEQVQSELHVWGVLALFFPRLAQHPKSLGEGEEPELADVAVERVKESSASERHTPVGEV